MSSPTSLAKGRRSRKETLGSENTETTLSSSAAPQSASVASAAADVGDRRYRFSSRSERRGKNPQEVGRFRSLQTPRNLAGAVLIRHSCTPVCRKRSRAAKPGHAGRAWQGRGGPA